MVNCGRLSATAVALLVASGAVQANCPTFKQLNVNEAGSFLALEWAFNGHGHEREVERVVIVRDGKKIGAVEGWLPRSNRKRQIGRSYIDGEVVPGRIYSYHVQAVCGSESTHSVTMSATAPKTACVASICRLQEIASLGDFMPWGLSQLADGTVLYTLKDDFSIWAMSSDGRGRRKIGALPPAGHSTDGGLLGIEVRPGQALRDNPRVYLYHSYGDHSGNRVTSVRFDSKSDRLDNSTNRVVVDGIPWGDKHMGGRLRFDPRGEFLYVAVGDLSTPESQPHDAADMQTVAGKVLRLPSAELNRREENQGDPGDNLKFIFTRGHRAPQGLAFDSANRLWEQEFGPEDNDEDETNLLSKGANYGWPCWTEAQGHPKFRKGSWCRSPEETHIENIRPAMSYKRESASCSGIAVVGDSLFVACLRGMRLIHNKIVDVSPDKATLRPADSINYPGLGRLRAVEPTHDKRGLWLITNNHDPTKTDEKKDDPLSSTHPNRIFLLTLQ